MGTDSKNIALNSDSIDIIDSDEFDMVSSYDLLLMSYKNCDFETNEASDEIFFNPLHSSIKEYKEEWNELYSNKEVDFEKLQKKSNEGNLRTSRFRSVWWRCLLGILHKQPKQWLCQLEIYRKHYNELYRELEQNPWNAKGNNPTDNPLSQESDSLWQKYFYDEELKGIIFQDVKRTFPGMKFFRKDNIQQIMVRILFCYARQNPGLSYRQGMHEILAPIIFVLYCDQYAYLHIKEEITDVNEDIQVILSSEYLEQDAYSIFKCIMSHIECSYRLNNGTATTPESYPANISKFDLKVCQNEVILRLDFIKKNILQSMDQELCEHLQNLDIPLHLFGIRWLRLLFGREFPLEDLLVLWDFIFSNNFETVNYIVAALLIAIREILLNGDYTDCLSNLMRYPSGIDVNFILNYALYLKNPEVYPCPNSYKPLEASSSATTKTEKENTQSPIHLRLKKKPRRSQWFADKNFFLLNENRDDDVSIVSGYAPDDPDLLKIEVEQSRAVLGLVYYKLVQYHSVLSTNLHGKVNNEVQAALDGLFELSYILKDYTKKSDYDIETACEAGEVKDQKSTNSQISVTKQRKKLETSESSNSEKKFHTLPKVTKHLKSGELKVFKHHEGGSIEGVPMTDPLHRIKL